MPRLELRHNGPTRWWRDAAAALDGAQRDGIRVVIPADPDWPTGLRALDIGEPVCLWARGPAQLPAQAAAWK